MYLKALSSLVVGAMSVGFSRASPVPLDLTTLGAPDSDLLVQEGIRLAQSRDIERRLSADFYLDNEWHDEVLFGGYDEFSLVE